MISLRVPSAPPCLAPFAAAPLPVAFDAQAFQACKRLVQRTLADNQHWQCAFCEAPINKGNDPFHLDHLLSQIHHPSRRFDIHNLVASCHKNDTCGHKHGSHSVPNALNPYLAKQLHFAMPCDSMGELYNASLSAAAWNFAQTQLNLNAPGLKSVRATVISHLQKRTIALGTNARRRLANLSTQGVGFISLHAQILGRFGFSVP